MTATARAGVIPAGHGPPTGGAGLAGDSAAAQALAPPAAVPAIALHNVTRVFATRRGRPPSRRQQITAVSGLSLTVPQGVVFGLLGPNGSGKTTTINMITGLLPPTLGTAEILGRDARRDRHVRSLLGVVPQETALYTELSAWDNLSHHAALYRIPRREQAARIGAVLEMVSLTDRAKDKVGTFSGGMQRRLAIARALLHGPSVVVLDEPTLGVDPQARAAIWGYIRGLAADGKTVLLTTNYLDEAADLCRTIAIIDHGRLVTAGTPADLQQATGGKVVAVQARATAGTLESVQDELRQMDGVTAVTATPTGPPGEHCLQVTTSGRGVLAPRVIGVIERRCTVLDVDVRAPSMDTVFLALTGDQLRD